VSVLFVMQVGEKGRILGTASCTKSVGLNDVNRSQNLDRSATASRITVSRLGGEVGGGGVVVGKDRESWRGSDSTGN
jgi:hypothetical protein